MSEIKELMDAETYYFGEEILDAGFVDLIIETEEEEEKETALINATALMKNCSEKLKELGETKEDLERAAACLSKLPLASKQTNQNPAPAGKNKSEEKAMNLQELLAKNPDAKNELNTLITEAREEGKKEVESRVAKAANFVNNENYNKSVSQTALEVMKGEKDQMSLDAAIAAVDAMKAEKESNEAKDETEKIPDTPAVDDTSAGESQASFDAKKKLIKENL